MSSKIARRNELRKNFEQKLERLTSVAYAIRVARATYEETKMASHDKIIACEEFINNSVQASKHDIAAFLAQGLLKRSCTSQRLFIQLI